MSSKPWVYIASPYTKGDQAINVRFQMRMWDTLLSLGVVPIAPLWSHFQHIHGPRPYQDWIDYDNEIITRCDACLRLDADCPGVGYVQHESTGADAEVELFKRLGKPVFFGLDSLENWLTKPAEHHGGEHTLGKPRHTPLSGLTLIGLAGHIGSGKSAAAAMIPGAHHLQWADPIYRGLAAMFDVPEEVLRDRQAKERRLSAGTVAVSPRDLARTLGTEWGRDVIHPDLWVSLTLRRIDRLAEATGRSVFAICGTRFPNEVAAIREHGGEVWWVDRPGLEVGGHKSDVALTHTECDRVIVNSGTLDKLRHNVEAAWQDFLASRAATTAVA